MLTASRFLLAIALSTCSAYGQRKDARRLGEAEVGFLQLVATDTTSNTLCLLPRGFHLGIQNPDTGRLLLLKKKRLNLFLLEGTHRVYVLEGGKYPALRRLDRTIFTGDNFEPMPFLRRDTLHSYAGAGRWTYRDFITYFKASEGEWELFLRSKGLENRWVPHTYDPDRDALYILGSTSVRHTDWMTIYRDSAFRYDFKSRRWETLGEINTDFPLRRRPITQEALVVRTTMGDLFQEDGDFLLVDLAGNRIARPKRRWSDSLSSILIDGEVSARIHLNDTLHVLSTGGTATHHRLRLSMDDFEPFRQSAVYRSSGPYQSPVRWAMATAGAAVAGLALWVGRKRLTRKPKGLSTKPPAEKVAEDREDSQGDHAVGKDPMFEAGTASQTTDAISRHELEELRKHLSSIEWELLTILAESTVAGKNLETEDVNKAIGVSQKDPSLQKSRRSVVIGRINRVFAQCTGRPDGIVIRERDHEEKRKYNYRLDEQMARLLVDLTEGRRSAT